MYDRILVRDNGWVGWELKCSSRQCSIEGLLEKMTFELKTTQSHKDLGQRILSRKENKDKEHDMRISMLY